MLPKTLHLVANFAKITEIITNLSEKIAQLKISAEWKSLYFDNKSRILSIFGEIMPCLCNRNHAFQNMNIEESSLFRELVLNFADFWWNNSIFMQNNRAFKKYHPREKFISR